MDVFGLNEGEGAGLGSVPVKLVFELGSVVLPVAELGHLAPGAVFTLAHSADDALEIKVNGTRIGYGSLVKTGDSIGVRITRLTGLD
jgi:type III secretion protein Q